MRVTITWYPSYECGHIAMFFHEKTYGKTRFFSIDPAPININKLDQHYSGNLTKMPLAFYGNYKDYYDYQCRGASRKIVFYTEKTFDQLTQWWKQYWGKKYNFFTNNCAHQVQNACQRFLGMKFSKSILPSSTYNAIIKFVNNNHDLCPKREPIELQDILIPKIR